MRIHADRIDREPRHGIRVRDVRRILAATPTGWLADVAEVHISNALGHYPYACFNRYDRTLTIYSRGLAPRQLVAPILSELAAHALGIKHRRWHRYSCAGVQRIQHVVEPIADCSHASSEPAASRLPSSICNPPYWPHERKR